MTYGTICTLAAPAAPPATDARTVTDPRNAVGPTLKVAVDTLLALSVTPLNEPMGVPVLVTAE